MSSVTPASTDNLQESVGIGSSALQSNSEDTEQEDLNGSTRGIPERSRDTILPGNVGRLEKGSSPGPLGDDNIGYKASFDCTASSVETLGSLGGRSESVLEPNQTRGDESEDNTEEDDHAVT